MSLHTPWAVAAAVVVLVSGAFGAEDRVSPGHGASEITRVWKGHAPVDPRLQAVRTLYQGSGFKPYTDKEHWQARAEYLQQQVLLAAGLWPMPEKCPLNATIHGKIDRGDYTVEKVFFQSYPGFYVTGSLYRPKGKRGPFPAVLSPHGHWANGRFYDAGEKEAQQQIKGGFEKAPDAARYPLQARCANLAKLGCVVFHYDMVGYADADPERFPHRATYRDVESDLYGISMFGLQTWDSIRALDFVLSLPDVDKERIACTGASGGGTQTFIMMAADHRLKVAAPVCMISAGDHQGGCVCENASLLRLFTDNVELAATFAPKPFVHPTATGDWTKEFLEKGLPEIKGIYRLFDAEQNVQAVRFTAEHNYNLNNRETVYNFFNKHLRLGHPEPIKEQKFTPITPEDLSVFDAEHPRPGNSVDAATLKKYLIDLPRKPMCGANRMVALRHMLATDMPPRDQVIAHNLGHVTRPGYTLEKLLLSRKDSPEQIPALLFVPDKAIGSATVVILPEGKAGLLMRDDAPTPLLTTLLHKGHAVLAPNVFFTGELSSTTNPTTNPQYEFFAGYNRTILANRVHDILTAVGYLRSRDGIKTINLVGMGKAGPWCLLARPLAGRAIARSAADVNRFEFDQVKSFADENYLPGVLRFGGLWPLASLEGFDNLLVYNTVNAERPEYLKKVYPEALQTFRFEPAATTADVAEWITR
ncbi:MAG TPA: acetylxylan esterase [Tepidisphaeraceae bacterium]|nr:acetylxylan esterase [Tepidisphaeraceae bacterium]